MNAMKARLLLLACCLLPVLTLPLSAADEEGTRRPRSSKKAAASEEEENAGGLLGGLGNMISSSTAGKMVGEYVERVEQEIEDKSFNELLDQYVMRPVKGAAVSSGNETFESFVNDFFGDNEDETGERKAGTKTETYLPKPRRVVDKIEAGEYVLEQAAKCASPIAVQMKGMTVAKARQITQQVFALGGATAGSFQVEGNISYFRFTYADDARIKACHRGHIGKELLTQKEQRAYEIALAVVKKVDKEHFVDYERAVALHDYLVLNCRYDKKMKRKLNGAATTMLTEGRGVCNAYMRAYSILLDLAGIENEYITGGNHAWNMVKLENSWTHVDVTWDDPVPDERGRVLHEWFGMTDTQIRKTHRWSKRLYTRKATNKELYLPNRISGDAFSNKNSKPDREDKADKEDK